MTGVNETVLHSGWKDRAFFPVSYISIIPSYYYLLTPIRTGLVSLKVDYLGQCFSSLEELSPTTGYDYLCAIHDTHR